MQTTLIRLDHLPARDRFDFWWETVATSVVSVDAISDHAADFWAEMNAVDLGQVQLSRVRSASFQARRTPRRIRQSDHGLYQLNLTFNGQSGLDQEGRQVLLRQHDFVLYDTSRPFHAWSVAGHRGPADGLVTQFPHGALRLPAKTIDRLLSVRIRAESGLGALLACLLEQLIGQRERYSPAAATRLSSAIIDLVTGMLAEHAGVEAGGGPETTAVTTALRVQAFIEEHLDGDLTPATVAAAHHMSLRHLQRLFERQGLSVAQWIRERRLDRARHDLADPRLDALAVRTIGARWGFHNDAHFNRAFCALYGISPGMYRRRVRDELSPPPEVTAIR
ncbi:helix-turn-helix domain-containing protein [Streptosporangium sp. CA-115845]|uniref:AraC-like ligand-binding domain-containing protein n=1 Tax=Streptosporangium sp. CA-115845 TaxID=3240071 RepID=UPI003D914481